MNGGVAGLARYPGLFASLVKIEHTVFALPFAFVGAFLAVDGVPTAHDLLWITVAMAGARSLAMGLNRLIDAGIDARNPRTASRELPSGRLRAWHVAAFCAAALAVATLLLYEHALVAPDDLRRLDAAFFTVNGVISVVFFAFVLADSLA